MQALKVYITEKLAEASLDIETIQRDLDMKRRWEDWHGVQDCGSDIREIQARKATLLEILKYINRTHYDG